jgi:hypothetical protein
MKAKTDLVCHVCKGSYPIHKPGCKVAQYLGVWKIVKLPKESGK